MHCVRAYTLVAPLPREMILVIVCAAFYWLWGEHAICSYAPDRWHEKNGWDESVVGIRTHEAAAGTNWTRMVPYTTRICM